MNIRSDFQSLPLITGDVALAASQKTAANPDAPVFDAASAFADQTHLSGSASLAAHAASLPDVREEKVESVRAAIAAGTYSVRSSDVAQSLMQYLLGGGK